ncbi:MAG TPA: sugar transferase [Candidatus Cottocaccamicrobium excrementipullorum]|nr:sugar transferase [Candidatus Cottocaccamicrobium excrementipullorum]
MYYRKPDNWLEHWDFVILDITFLEVAYIISCIFRNGIGSLYEQQVYFDVGLLIAYSGMCMIIFLNEHKEIRQRSRRKEAKCVLKYVGSVLITVVAYLFLTKNGENFSRIVFLIFGILALFLILLERIVWKRLSCKWRDKVSNKRGILLLAESKKVPYILTALKKDADNAITVVGLVLLDRGDLIGTRIEEIEVVCGKECILSYIQTNWVDEILICTEYNKQLPYQFEEQCVEMGITVHRELAEITGDRGKNQIEIMGNYVVFSSSARFVSWKLVALKRILDICGALIGLILTGIVAVFLCPAIYLASPGPVFFSQIRVGKNGRKFRIYKFRSMYLDAEERKKELLCNNKMKGCMFKLDADPRIIGSGKDGTQKGLGWFIRTFSIDEFPQFWNVLKGEMSLVGTRPPTLDEWEHYDLHHRARMAIKPGLTGIWQVSGRSNVIDFEDVVRMDKEYIQNWNIGLDLQILFKTLWIVVTGKGAR